MKNGIDEARLEWDPAKADSNAIKHGITFQDASLVFDDPLHFIVESSRPEHGEARAKAIGTVNGRVIAVVFTTRGKRYRIISARRARPNEQRPYDLRATSR